MVTVDESSRLLKVMGKSYYVPCLGMSLFLYFPFGHQLVSTVPPRSLHERKLRLKDDDLC